jgi:hypothetical protein
MGNVFLFAFFMVILFSIKHLDIRAMLNLNKKKFVVCKKLKMKRSKLKQIKNQFFLKKYGVNFAFCFLLAIIYFFLKIN